MSKSVINSKTAGWSSLITFAVLLLAWISGFSSRLFAVIRFESIIHEFDPWYGSIFHSISNYIHKLNCIRHSNAVYMYACVCACMCVLRACYVLLIKVIRLQVQLPGNRIYGGTWLLRILELVR